MKAENTSDTSTLPARNARLIQNQRVAINVLLLALIPLAVYTKLEQQQADALRVRVRYLQTRMSGHEIAPVNSAQYPVELIADDDSRIPLKGKALDFDLGDGRMLNVDLKRQEGGLLTMWAPWKRDESHFSRFVLHPHCANVLSLELDRVKVGSTDDIVTPEAPR